MQDYDIIIVGAGIAGTSLAYELANIESSPYKKICVLEQEYAPGYHSTGRSAAFWSQTYGGPYIEPLTSASGEFLRNPPKKFYDGSFLYNRGALNIARTNQTHLVTDMIDNFADNAIELHSVEEAYIDSLLPNRNNDWNYAIWEPECSDIDVAALHNAYMSNAKKLGVDIICSSSFDSASHSNGHWTIGTSSQSYTSQILVNAAGAWANDVTSKADIQPIDIKPFRRTMVELELHQDISIDMPLIVALDGSFYFKAMGQNHIWLSPHDEIASNAVDAAPEEIDVAIAIDRFQNIVDWKIKRVTKKWAGLRSFSKDRLPVIGYDKLQPNYFSYVGQGGFGIQTSHAAAKIAAHILNDKPIPENLSHIDISKYSPNRF